MDTAGQAPAGRNLLSRWQKAAFGILAPLLVSLVVFWAILSTATGEGPSVGGRGTVLALVLFPTGLLASGLLNIWVLFVPIRRPASAFILGAAVPAIMLFLAYSYLWRTGPFTH